MDKSYIIQFPKKGKSRKSDLQHAENFSMRTSNNFPSTLCDRYVHQGPAGQTDHFSLRPSAAAQTNSRCGDCRESISHMGLESSDVWPPAVCFSAARKTANGRKTFEDKRWLDLKPAANGQIRKSGCALAFPCREIASKIALFFLLFALGFLFIYSAFNDAGYCHLG